MCEERERELSLWERSERSDLGEGDLALRLPLLRDGLGEALCRLFLGATHTGRENTVRTPAPCCRDLLEPMACQLFVSN